MPVEIRIPTPFRPDAGGQAFVEVPGGTVGEALDSLFELHPGLRPLVLAEDGRLAGSVHVFLAGADIRFLDGLRTVVAEGQQVAILPAIAGGAPPSRGKRRCALPESTAGPV